MKGVGCLIPGTGGTPFARLWAGFVAGQRHGAWSRASGALAFVARSRIAHGCPLSCGRSCSQGDREACDRAGVLCRVGGPNSSAGPALPFSWPGLFWGHNFCFHRIIVCIGCRSQLQLVATIFQGCSRSSEQFPPPLSSERALGRMCNLPEARPAGSACRRHFGGIELAASDSVARDLNH